MKNRLVLLLLIGLIKIGALNAQCCPYLGNIEIIPENPNASDSIYLVTNVTTPNLGSYLGYEIENNANNEIVVRACYWEGIFTTLTDFTDTINLGVKDLGMYTVNFIALSSISDVSCTPIDSNSIELMFEVGDISSIDNENDNIENRVKCFPNPLSAKNLSIQSTKRIKEIEIMNTNGVVILKIENPNTFNYEVDMEKLSFGTYLIKIIDENDITTIEKVLKIK